MAEEEKVEEATETIEDEARDKILQEFLRSWNGFIRCLMEGIKYWEKYSSLYTGENISLEELSLPAQKIVVRFNPRGDLGFMLEDLSSQLRMKATLKELLIKLR